MITDKQINRNIRLFYAITALEYAYFNDAVLILFGREYLHLTYFKAGSLFFIGWYVSVTLDFWGGVIADKIGRKRCTIYGISLQLISYMPFLFSKTYLFLLLGSIVWGIGVALSSNALHALIYEQFSRITCKSKRTYAHVSATSQIYLFISIGLATIIGGFAYTIDPRLPYLLIIITLFIAAIATCLMYVPQDNKLDIDNTSFFDVVRTATNTFWSNKSLRYFIIIGFLLGMFGDMLYAYYQPYFINIKVSAVTLGLLFGAIRAASAFGSYIMRRLSASIAPSYIQILNASSIVLTAMLLFFLNLPYVLAAPLLFGINSGLTEPNMRLFVNKHAKDNVRASVLSFSTTVISLGVGSGFVTAYYLSDKVSARTILSLIILGSTIIILLRIYYTKMLDRNTAD